MKALHFLLDHNFVKTPRQRFEQFFPGQNIFVIHSTKPEDTKKKYPEGFHILDMTLSENQQKVMEMCRAEHVDKLLLHGLHTYQPRLVEQIKNEYKTTVYWIFWGYDLYETLGYEKGYRLIDEPLRPWRRDALVKPYPILKYLKKLRGKYGPEAYRRIMNSVDYFCFWNKGDYDLLIRYFNLPIKYKFFAYSANMHGETPQNLFPLIERETKNVMVNHQASKFGNHATIYKRLHTLDHDKRLNVISPLSYGIPAIRDRAISDGKKYFGDRFNPVLEYMPADKYFEMLRSIDVAIFGQRRQEASGNIINMLKNGVKVFLRNDNNLLKYYRDKGYKIYSFEDDLKSPEDLKALSLEEQQYNRECYMRNLLYYDDFMPQFFDE